MQNNNRGPQDLGCFMLAKLALDVFDSAGEFLFADQGHDVRDAQSA